MRSAAFPLMTATAMVLGIASQASAEIAWQTNLRAAHAQAQSEGKMLLLHFYSDNCSWCDKLEAGAFQESSVAEAVSKNFVPVKIHANSSPKLAAMFKVTKFPSDVIVTTGGKALSHSVSPQEPDRYVQMLASAVPANTGVADITSQIATTKNAPKADAGATVPGYAVSAEPANKQLPDAKAKLASSRTDGLSLAMPEKVTNEIPKASDLSVSLDPSKSKAKLATPAASEPELAMEGYCPISVVNEGQWVEGNPKYGVIHLGKLYLFASDKNMQTFLADPIPYTPVLNEIDVVRFFEEQIIVPGKREWAMQDPNHKRMFFFADEAAMLHFEKEWERYVDTSIEVMKKAVKDSNPGT